MGLDILIYVNDQADDTLSHQVSAVEVYEKMDQNTTYKLSFMVDICDEDVAASLDKKTSPGSMLSVVARVKDQLVCLVKGPVTQQESHLQHGGAGSWIKVEGEDTGYTLEKEVKFQVTDGTDADIVTSLLGNSNPQMTADVESTPSSSHDENSHSLVQRESDLSLIRSLARRNGFHFWITYAKDGKATGHFRSRSLDGTPAATFVINSDDYNIESFRVKADARAPSQTVGKQLNLLTKEVMGGTTTLNDPTLGKDGLATVSGGIQSMHLAPVVDDTGAFTARSQAALRDAQWFIHATCKTSVFRLCNVVRSHTLVSLQGAGTRYSGNYFVAGVKHTIDPAAHIMELELERNAWGNAPSGGAGLLNSIF